MSKTREIREDLYQRMHGFKPVRRVERKRCRSEWYYLDPRYDNELHQIDVVNENSPNPRISGIVADDMDKNPQDYYIWRTKGDNKVRGKHAEREGKIFNWHIPPEGGARIKTTVAPVVFTASGEVLLMSKGGVNRL